MTPEERQLVTELFDRLASLEEAERDPAAERAIEEGLRRAPNAVYALVQTALVQDEALRRANARIQELEAQVTETTEPPRPTSFLGSMREALSGRRETAHGSVPTVRPQSAPGVQPAYAAPPGYPPFAPGMAGPSGGSFLGTAAAAAAGVIGGSLLLDGIRGMMGSHHAFGASPANAAQLGGAGGSGSPWGDSAAGSGNLAHEAGLDDIGRSGQAPSDPSQTQGFLDSGQTVDMQDAGFDYQDDDPGNFDDPGDFDGDGGGFGGDGGGGDN